MKTRCYSKSSIDYKNYGLRGITICGEWFNDRESFFKWAISNGYEKGLTIERINNNKGYSPNNCVFKNRVIQCNNKRNNHIIEYNGEKPTMIEFCRKHNLSYIIFQQRINVLNWTIDRSMINCGVYKDIVQYKKRIVLNQ